MVTSSTEPPSQRLLDAVTHLLVREGYVGISIRRVASAAGVSVGAVQHHFPTKDAMLKAAMEQASRKFQQRLEEVLDRDATAEQALRTLLLELLGLHETGRIASVLWVLRAARATADISVAEQHAAEWQEVENLIASLLWSARPDQPQRWTLDQAGFLLALTDGLALAALNEPTRMPSTRARTILDAALTSVLTMQR